MQSKYKIRLRLITQHQLSTLREFCVNQLCTVVHKWRRESSLSQNSLSSAYTLFAFLKDF